MELPNTENIGSGFLQLPMARQIGLMVGFAACVALAVAIVLWSQKPSYRMLYGNLSDQEMMEISTALDQAGIKYDVNGATGAILVDAGQVHEARMRLAASGLPKGSGTGYELLDKDQGFGTSQFIETARYQRAVEGELAKTIASLNNVQSARVHLAIPKQSAFVRDRKKPSASVMLSLYQGRVMSASQASSIAHLVASSVPNLEVEDVTVVDQNGRLLTKSEEGDDMSRSNTRLEYRKSLEADYVKRILEIIEPIVGVGKVKAQVAADLDFTMTEQTQETYNPDLPSIRSEQTVEEESTGAANNGVPGTLSNQPAQAGNTVTPTSTNANQATNSARRSVRNYELDKTISHTRHQVGILKRLSAAIVIDEKETTDGTGKVTSTPLSQQEMDKITSLVKEAIGFDVGRGDSVNVINAPFQPVPEGPPAAQPSIFDQPWLWDVGRQLLGIGAVLLLIFVVLKPVLKSLAEKGVGGEASEALPQIGADGEPLALAGGQLQPMLPAVSYDDQLEIAKAIAKQEPHRMANIVKDWIEKDG